MKNEAEIISENRKGLDKSLEILDGINDKLKDHIYYLHNKILSLQLENKRLKKKKDKIGFFKKDEGGSEIITEPIDEWNRSG